MLAEDAANEASEFAQVMKHWNDILKKCQRSKAFCDGATDKIRVRSWKEERTYVFQAKKGKQVRKRSLCGRSYGYNCVTEISYLTQMPRESQLEGLSIGDIEEISSGFFLKDSPIKCLLDAGFTLNLIVPRDFLEL
jgi:hypothetical protein